MDGWEGSSVSVGSLGLYILYTVSHYTCFNSLALEMERIISENIHIVKFFRNFFSVHGPDGAAILHITLLILPRSMHPGKFRQVELTPPLAAFVEEL
jgi:hypothetical protein